MTTLRTIKNQMRAAGQPILIKDIKRVDTVIRYDFNGIYHTDIKLVTLKDGRVYRLTAITVDEDGFYSKDSGRFNYSADFVGYEGRF